MAGRGGCFCFGLCHPKSQAGQWPFGKGGSRWAGEWDPQVGRKSSGQGHPEGECYPGRMGDELSVADLAKKGQDTEGRRWRSKERRN